LIKSFACAYKELFLVLLVSFSTAFPPAEALVINSYSSDPALYDRFISGTYPSNPAPNPNFFASSYDWSGVGWMSSNQTRSITMVSPLHFVVANHWQVPPESSVTFLNGGGELKNYTVDKYSIFSFTDGNGTHTSDLALGWLTAPIPETDDIAHYSVLSADDPATPEFDLDWYLNKDVYVYGWHAKAGENTISDFTWAGTGDPPETSGDLTLTSMFDYESLGYYPGLAGAEPGDSGSPTFMPWNGQLTVIGTHFGVSALQPAVTWTTFDAFVPFYVKDINLAMEASCYSVDTIDVVPEPATCLLFLSGIAGLLAIKRRSTAH
jgi:hypothetical protein